MNKARAKEYLNIVLASLPGETAKTETGQFYDIELEGKLLETVGQMLKEDNKLTYNPLDNLSQLKSAFHAYIRKTPKKFSQGDHYHEPERFLATYLEHISGIRIKSDKGFEDISLLSARYDRDGMLTGVSLRLQTLQDICDEKIRLGNDMDGAEIDTHLAAVQARRNSDAKIVLG